MFNHTWAEGIQACKGSTSSVLVESAQMVMLGNARVAGGPINATWPLNSSGQQRTIKCAGGASHAGTMDGEGCVVVSKVVVRICVLLSIYLYIP